jgi:hypothetical protein
MKLEEFKALSEQEQENYLSSIDTSSKTIDDLTAERDSFKTENDSLRTQLEENKKELKATKELNFTMARKIDAKPAEDLETVLHNIIKEFR